MLTICPITYPFDVKLLNIEIYNEHEHLDSHPSKFDYTPFPITSDLSTSVSMVPVATFCSDDEFMHTPIPKRFIED